MPTRLIREGILTSTRVNALDDAAEVFFRRLLSVVDDFGRCEAHAALLRASLYPLKLDRVSEGRIEKLLTTVAAAGLIDIYEVKSLPGKRFLQVLNFRQQTRSKSKHPPADAKHPCTDVHLGGGVSEGGDEGVGGVGADALTRECTRPLPQPLDTPEFRAMWEIWQRYLIEKSNGRSIPSQTLDGHLKICAAQGHPPAALAALQNAIDLGMRKPAPPFEKNSSGGAAGGGPVIPFDPTKPHAHTGGLAEVT
jgi:hypothetical protein